MSFPAARSKVPKIEFFNDGIKTLIGNPLKSAQEKTGWGSFTPQLYTHGYMSSQAELHNSTLSEWSQNQTTLKKFDTILYINVLEHIEDIHGFLDRMQELLEPGSPVYVEVPHQFDSFLERINGLRGEKRQFTAYSIHHHFFFTPCSLKQLLQDHGFDIISLTTFLPARRGMRPPSLHKWILQTMLWLADKLSESGDVISIWAQRQR